MFPNIRSAASDDLASGALGLAVGAVRGLTSKLASLGFFSGKTLTPCISDDFPLSLIRFSHLETSTSSVVSSSPSMEKGLIGSCSSVCTNSCGSYRSPRDKPSLFPASRAITSNGSAPWLLASRTENELPMIHFSGFSGSRSS